MLGAWFQKPRFDPDMLSSIWVMACRDESPVVTAFSIAFRLGGGITPDDVMELVKGRRELFRLGLTPVQSRTWKERYRELAADGGKAKPVPKRRPPARKTAPQQQQTDEKAEATEHKPQSLPDWLRVFDDEGTQADQDKVRAWLGDKRIGSSRQALDRFLDQGFVIDENVIRSVFRLEAGLDAEPSDLATVNWGLEHIERLRRGRAETRQSLVALTTGIGGVAIGACVALTAPMVTTIYQGRPLDTNRLTFDHQTLVNGYGAIAAAIASARGAAEKGDDEALASALTEIDKSTASIAPLIGDKALRDELRQRRTRLADACGPGKTPDPPGLNPSPALTGCPAAIEDLQELLDGPLTEAVAR